jgi:leukotriene-A4 hydrolase
MNAVRLGMLTLIVMGSCNSEIKKTPPAMTDPHSYSNPEVARVTHLHWKADVDMDSKTIHATAKWDIEVAKDGDVIILDAKGLVIKKVSSDNQQRTEFKLSNKDSLLGQGLAILITPETKSVSIEYTISATAEALQWLSPQQTADKKYPFLFTQSQAILARTWIPCQDSPNVKFTYDADVSVPKDLIALMSASNPKEKNDSGQYHFEMKQPIPSYLLALTVGNVAYKSISDRSGIYAEPSILEKAAWEFEDLEKMIATAETLYGPYRWAQYDVIVLPPSFPFGGMENPRLTFATPTILAGDRSLTSLIAHELAHSWSGNLVTNATWNDFWLNEGFTVYFENRIMEQLYGRDYSEMLATLALQDLQQTIKDLKADNHEDDTKLKLSLEGRNPDDGVTDIAYDKGYFFLRRIEEKFGRPKFDAFLKDYFADNAFKSMDTEKFIPYIENYYQKNFEITLNNELFNTWIYSPGLPEDCPKPASSKFDKVNLVLQDWKIGKHIDPKVTSSWSTHEWLHFIKNLPDSLTPEQMKNLDDFGGLTHSGNAEILSAWFVHVIRHQYKTAYPRLENFLVQTGRRKFLSPLYSELIKTPEGKVLAKEIYARARPNYHYVATQTFDKMLN